MAKEPPEINSAKSPAKDTLPHGRGLSRSEEPLDQGKADSEAHGPSNLRLLRAKRLAILGQAGKATSTNPGEGDSSESELTSADSRPQDHHSSHLGRHPSTPGMTNHSTKGKADHKIEVALDAGSGSASVELKLPPCALKNSHCHCRGRGYQLEAEGAFASAVLCDCVKRCPACLGQASLTDHNKSRPCASPSPRTIVGLLKEAQIPSRYMEAKLQDFIDGRGAKDNAYQSRQGYRPNARRAPHKNEGNGAQVASRLQRWVNDFKPRGGRGLIIEGPVGVGKTYMLAALASALAGRGFTVRFTDFFQLLGELRAGFSEGKADAAQLAPLINVDVLVIDELGKGRGRDFDKTVLDQLVCGRYNQNKTIVASTNYQLRAKSGAQSYNINLDQDVSNSSDFAPDTFGGLEQRVGQRIYSRLCEMTTFIELQGNDYRKTQTGNGEHAGKF